MTNDHFAGYEQSSASEDSIVAHASAQVTPPTKTSGNHSLERRMGKNKTSGKFWKL